ncbi:MAG: hypothetical protein QNJ70_04040 [Xenococcaceae cyanobacterium MO_207.B15]|nr:hypothetical protein [Xenococcaceae cyanobacterium MO_207.B15]
MKRGRGNPEAEKYHFKTDRPEACTAQISIRIPPSLKAKLKDIDNWQELVRQTLEEAAKTRVNLTDNC